MLSRTADHLFWMARYIERAENTARMLTVSLETALLPQSADAAEDSWRSMLSISELLPAYRARHDEVTPEGVMAFMVSDFDNPSSIAACLQAARENARAVRGVLTTEVWETHNKTWLDLQRMLKANMLERNPATFFEWVRFRSHLSRGVNLGTMLRDEAFYFQRMGTFLERADNTARLVDVKFHGPQGEYFGASLDQPEQEKDFYHWSAVLSSVSGLEVYRRIYRDVVKPERVAEMLILHPDLPRSLANCMNEVVTNLSQVASDPRSESVRLAGRLRADLQYGRIADILATGLHAWLTQFLDRVNALGGRISKEFLLPQQD
ncbi:hypothetical protein CCO03_09045 [Comamonas serinivorans]|uniref:DUF403 domain-containing protein n=1 Tax=Comamonas serinivorans TaxID=1082851 RepID=A0A1Y0EMD0_9BURK|nr:alpha-E domain-containing protein [Comamonas serinivorans]ARU04805.1 hypothetical protein CCO03_09045 [Comamonas serinivorans]